MTGATARPEPDAQAGAPAPSRLPPAAQPGSPAPSPAVRPGSSRLPPDVTRIRVLRDDNDGLRTSADFGDIPAALAAVERHMRHSGVYSIMIVFDP